LVIANITCKIKDFDQWFLRFRRHARYRVQNGSKGVDVFFPSETEGTVSFLIKWENEKSLMEFFKSDEFRNMMEEGSAVSNPTIRLLNYAGSFDR